MKRLTPANHTADRLYPCVAKGVAELLASGLPVSTPAVFVKMGIVSEANLRAWREGKAGACIGCHGMGKADDYVLGASAK